MDKKMIRNLLIQKENDHKNVNKRDIDHTGKLDRLLMLKKINSLEDKENKQIRLLKNSKEMRIASRSLVQKPRYELKPINQQLTNTQQYCQVYADNIVDQSQLDNLPLGSFLSTHDIDKGLRARMLDWMVEVTSSYKFTPKTYFSSAYLMDRYFRLQDQRLPITKLHIIGVIAMLIATKMDEVYPLKIKTVYEKIVHKKIDKKELLEMEGRMIHKLGFKLNVWSFYDIALFKLHQNGLAKNDEAIKQIEDLCQLIGKFIVFNYQLYGHYQANALAEGLLRSACKVYGTEKARLAMGQKDVLELTKDQHTCVELILDTVRNFKSSFRNLMNIYKFSEEATLSKLEQFLKCH